MQAGGINLFGVVADSIDRERLNQTYQANRERWLHRRQPMGSSGLIRAWRPSAEKRRTRSTRIARLPIISTTPTSED
jgi:hypothetical protein